MACSKPFPHPSASLLAQPHLQVKTLLERGSTAQPLFS
jgi:hypothetical protein